MCVSVYVHVYVHIVYACMYACGLHAHNKVFEISQLANYTLLRHWSVNQILLAKPTCIALTLLCSYILTYSQ